MGKRQAISHRLRFEVLKRDGFACRYCGQRPPDVVLHLDHVVPVSRGGTDDMSNLCACCPACNLGKADEPVVADTICAQLRPSRPETAAERAAAEAWEAQVGAMADEYAAIHGGIAAENGALWPVFKILRRRLGEAYDEDAILDDMRRYVRRGVSIDALLAEAQDCGSYREFAMATKLLFLDAARDGEG